MPEEAHVRKAFEAVLGEELPAEIGDEVVLRIPVAVTARTLTDRASVTSREIGTTGDSTKVCAPRAALDVGGTSRTAANGRVKFRLSDYHCLEAIVVFNPVNFVATPQSKVPAFLTSVQTLTGSPFDDVSITVFSWDANGNPMQTVSFDWRCFVPFDRVVE